jgi:hypothetical protein
MACTTDGRNIVGTRPDGSEAGSKPSAHGKTSSGASWVSLLSVLLVVPITFHLDCERLKFYLDEAL